MNMEYQTDRLLLKILTPDYLRETLSFQMRNKEIFEEYEPVRPAEFYTLSYQHNLLKCEYQLALKQSTIRFYVFLKEDLHTIIGTVCLHDILRGAYSCCEIGYKFDTAYCHKGYAKEAICRTISIVFDELELHRIFARVSPKNLPSIHLLQSLAFTEEGLERQSLQIHGVWTDHLRFSLLRSDFYGSS